MTISVIIPVYNAETYLKECIESIINQTYKDLEIILINDGSKDKSGIICDKYQEKDKRIKVIHKKNQGVSATRNIGLQEATGDVITFVDSDDTLDLDMYEILIKLMEKYDADVSHCGYKHLVGEKVIYVHDTREIVLQGADESLECLVGSKLFVGSLWNKLYRREILYGIYFREDLRINEDILYNFEVFRKINKAVFADYAKYNYIAHPATSACFVTPEKKKLQDVCIVNEYMYNELKKTKLVNVAGERYLRSLCNYFRMCYADRSLKDYCNKIVLEMKSIEKEIESLSIKIKISVLLICYMPQIYNLLYTVYNKIRKPNWEV